MMQPTHTHSTLQYIHISVPEILNVFVKIYCYVGLSNNKYGEYLKSKNIFTIEETNLKYN
ncbi:hypothetical protein J830_4655 [Acinetobacter baumannii 25691_7]|nr:hypothetical protein J830_4655 [Acinetobacter baumannii 25691_7]